MKKYLKLKTENSTNEFEIYPTCYPYNRTLAILLYKKGKKEPDDGPECITCCLDDAPGKNRAYIDVNNMGVNIILSLEKCGFGKRTGKSYISGYVRYPEFEFNEKILKEYTNKDYEQYLEWQSKLKKGEVYIRETYCICKKEYTFIVKKKAAEMYYEYKSGANYLIQNIFPKMPVQDRGLFARGQNICNECLQQMISS